MNTLGPWRVSTDGLTVMCCEEVIAKCFTRDTTLLIARAPALRDALRALTKARTNSVIAHDIAVGLLDELET